MSVISFLNDLGIIPNEGTGLENDINLLQGQKYMEYGRVYEKSIEPHLHQLQKTDLIDSVIETMDGHNSVKSSAYTSKNEMSSNEKKFNKIMVEYSLTYKLLMEERNSHHPIKNNKIHLLKKLEELNKKLIYLSQQIVKEVDSTQRKHKAAAADASKHQASKHQTSKHQRAVQHQEDVRNYQHELDTLQHKINEKKQIYNSYIMKLKHEQSQLGQDYMNTLSGQEETSRFNVISNIYIIVFSSIIAIIIIMMLLNLQTENSNKILIILICLLAAVYLKNNYF